MGVFLTVEVKIFLIVIWLFQRMKAGLEKTSIRLMLVDILPVTLLIYGVWP